MTWELQTDEWSRLRESCPGSQDAETGVATADPKAVGWVGLTLHQGIDTQLCELTVLSVLQLPQPCHQQVSHLILCPGLLISPKVFADNLKPLHSQED